MSSSFSQMLPWENHNVVFRSFAFPQINIVTQTARRTRMTFQTFLVQASVIRFCYQITGCSKICLSKTRKACIISQSTVDPDCQYRYDTRKLRCGQLRSSRKRKKCLGVVPYSSLGRKYNNCQWTVKVPSHTYIARQ